MPNSDSSSGGWHTVAQPFYILSIVVGALILGSVTALSVRGCFRRREYRRRFVRVLDGGHAQVRFTVMEQESEGGQQSRNKISPNQKPTIEETMLDIRGNAAQRNGLSLPHTLPLSLTLLPSSLVPPDGYLLHLLRTPSFFTSAVRTRIQIARYLRSNNRNPLEAPELPEGQRGSLMQPTSFPVQVAFVVAMPAETKGKKHLTNAVHDSSFPVAGQELCIGALLVPWMLSNDPEEWELLEASKRNQGVNEEEEDADLASTIRTRRTRQEDLGAGASVISSQGPYAAEHGEYESSYLPRSHLPSEASIYNAESYQPSLHITDPAGSVQNHSSDPPTDPPMAGSYAPSLDRAYLAPPPRSLHGSNRSIRFEDEPNRATSEQSTPITPDSRVAAYTLDSLSQTTSTEVGEGDYDADEERNLTIRRRGT